MRRCIEGKLGNASERICAWIVSCVARRVGTADGPPGDGCRAQKSQEGQRRGFLAEPGGHVSTYRMPCRQPGHISRAGSTQSFTIFTNTKGLQDTGPPVDTGGETQLTYDCTPNDSCKMNNLQFIYAWPYGCSRWMPLVSQWVNENFCLDRQDAIWDDMPSAKAENRSCVFRRNE